jgi:L-malate glycosyltransferase
MTPIPIAIVLRTFEPGGTEHQMIELVRRLDPRRWTVHVACFHATGAWCDRVTDAAASVAEFPVRSFTRPDILRHVREFVGWCHRRRISIVQATGMPTNLFALPAAALARVPVRIGARREINANRTAVQLIVQRGAYACATTVAANSRAASRRLRLEGVPAHKVVVVPNGLDANRFGARPAHRPPRTIAIVANLRPEKRHDVLIDAAPSVLERFRDARFHVIGDGPERERLEALVAARGLSHAFAFLGHQSDVQRRLEDVDVSVLCSSSEGFPNAVLEALAAGVPVVASDLPAVRELIVHGESGLLVPSGDSVTLAAALCRLLADPALARRLGDCGRSNTIARFSFDRMVNGFEALYLAELERHRRRHAFRGAAATADRAAWQRDAQGSNLR